MRIRDIILRSTRALQPLATAVDVGTLYYVTDESIIERSNGTIWQIYSGASAAGVTQLTGDVTAGPGSGSQIATIANDAIITAKILNDAITTAKIVNDAVTYAKLQNLTTARLLGRATAGSGDAEEITLGTNLSFTGTTLNAAGGGGGAGWTLIETRAIGSGASEDFINLNSNELLLMLVAVTCGDNATTDLRVSVDNGSTFLSTSGDYKLLGTVGSEVNATSMIMTELTTGSIIKTSFRFILNANGTTAPKFSWVPQYSTNTYRIPTTSAINAVRFKPGTGNWAGAGNAFVYGR